MASFKIIPGWSHCVKINVAICISLIKPLKYIITVEVYTYIKLAPPMFFFFVCVTPVPAPPYLLLERTWLIQPSEMFWMFWEWRTSRSQLDWQPSGETPTNYAGVQPRPMCAPLITQSARSEPNVAQDDADTRGGGACVLGPFTSLTGTNTQGKRSSTLHAYTVLVTWAPSRNNATTKTQVVGWLQQARWTRWTHQMWASPPLLSPRCAEALTKSEYIWFGMI